MQEVPGPIRSPAQRAQRQVDQAPPQPIARACRAEAVDREHPPEPTAIVAGLAYHGIVGIRDRQFVVMSDERRIVVTTKIERDRA